MVGKILNIKDQWVIEYHGNKRLPVFHKSLEKIQKIAPNDLVDFEFVLVSPTGRKVNPQDVSINTAQCMWFGEIQLDEDLKPIVDWKEELEKCKKSPYYFFTKYIQVEGKPATTFLSEEEFNTFFIKFFRK